MLSKKYRLPIQKMLKEKSTAVKTPYFLIKIFRNSLPYSRFGVIVSKKIARLAVRRNKLRRLVFSLVRPYSKKIGGKDYLIIISPAIKELKKEEVGEKLKEYISKILPNG
ncbi:MAG: ribonuclease P protein component [Candidatus Harrisonbacteria bacterium RIFCSPLOWO2_02_FULL_41_11]|uniref:Ribonuclease P protein component n=1 Tax=Candidatus Harrisonbacteria bacterium RIFCSPHIGHO2_02_FULL_42_16 TaxID=1798404 RepID=A0A1G1ZHU2_9BACT|nr:MAG: ribonuclease P protein component [Candidatus Harrisonbacteria bacterium RIFCSPHIGHO2_02_FULL_42_16]OGY67117.1 MAG: ribonuclease P protein component [Candidatus Harrisonbacteria bacterium RIFCSPLOWO2_02_FULL_41_11]